MIKGITYWRHDKKLDICFLFNSSLDSDFISNQTIPNNEMEIINYAKNNFKRLLESRGHSLKYCSLHIQINHTISLTYMPVHPDSDFTIYSHSKELNELEQEVVNKIKELKEQDNEN